MANAMVITSTFTYTACEFPTSVAKIFSITRCFYIMLIELRSWDMLTCQGQTHKLPLDVSWMSHNSVDLLWEASFMKQVKYNSKYLLSWTQCPHLRRFHVSICRVRRYADGPVTLRLLSHDQSWAGENTWRKQTIVILTYLQDEEDIDIDADEQLSNKHRKKKNKVKTSQVQAWKPLS